MPDAVATSSPADVTASTNYVWSWRDFACDLEYSPCPVVTCPTHPHLVFRRAGVRHRRGKPQEAEHDPCSHVRIFHSNEVEPFAVCGGCQVAFYNPDNFMEHFGRTGQNFRIMNNLCELWARTRTVCTEANCNAVLATKIETAEHKELHTSSTMPAEVLRARIYSARKLAKAQRITRVFGLDREFRYVIFVVRDSVGQIDGDRTLNRKLEETLSDLSTFGFIARDAIARVVVARPMPSRYMPMAQDSSISTARGPGQNDRRYSAAYPKNARAFTEKIEDELAAAEALGERALVINQGLDGFSCHSERFKEWLPTVPEFTWLMRFGETSQTVFAQELVQILKGSAGPAIGVLYFSFDSREILGEEGVGTISAEGLFAAWDELQRTKDNSGMRNRTT